MSEVILNAFPRKNKGKSANRYLRQKGKIPAILYGPRGNFQLEMEEETTRQYLEKLSSSHELVKMKVNSSDSKEVWEGKVLLQEVQKHSYKNKLIHLDFLEPYEGRPLKLKIQINVIGESPGVKEGGVLQLVVREIPVLCPADRIPPNIEIDVSELNLGQTLKVQDVKIPDFLRLLTQENFPVISIVGRLKTLEEEEEQAALLAAEEGIEEDDQATEEKAVEEKEEKRGSEE